MFLGYFVYQWYFYIICFHGQKKIAINNKRLFHNKNLVLWLSCGFHRMAHCIYYCILKKLLLYIILYLGKSRLGATQGTCKYMFGNITKKTWLSVESEICRFFGFFTRKSSEKTDEVYFLKAERGTESKEESKTTSYWTNQWLNKPFRPIRMYLRMEIKIKHVSC